MPSRKVVSIFIICVALVFAIVFSSNSKTIKAVSKTVGGSLSSGPRVELAENSDWQAQVEELGKVSAGATGSSTETLTDEFSRSFMTNYLSLKQSDSFDSTSANNLINQSVQFIEDTNTKTYTVKDIIVSADNSKLAITGYGNNLGAALKNNTPKQKKKNEMLLFRSMMETNDPKISADLKNVASVYKDLAVSFSKITVPSTMTDSHLKFVNALDDLSESTNDMSQGLSDPIKGLRALGVYTQGFQAFTVAKGEIQTKILKSGANYKQGENGYYFFFGI